MFVLRLISVGYLVGANRIRPNSQLLGKCYLPLLKTMKKSIYILFFLGFFVSETYSQEIRIKRQFFVPYPQYVVGEQYIGNNVHELTRFVELHSQDSLLIQQLHDSERLSKIYPKIYLYSAVVSGVGAVGLIYVYTKAAGSIFKPQSVYSDLLTIARISIVMMSIGTVGIVVAGGYFISSQIKLRKAIKGYNSLQPKISFEIQPFMDANFSSGLSLKMTF